MAKNQSLDDMVKQEAIQFADQIKKAAEFAETEMEIQMEAFKALSIISEKMGLNLRGRHNHTIGTGRPDSVYSCVIIEYKDPKSPGDRLSSNINSSGNRKVINQLKKRFFDFKAELKMPLDSLFGVGCDGNYFIFVRYRDDKWNVEKPMEVNRRSSERFLWALFNMGTKGKPFAPEYLAGDFGSDSPLSHEGIKTLYNTICSTSSPKAQVFFQQWKILFGEVCGYDVNTPSDKIKKLAEFYKIEGKVNPAELLFSIHTYYSIFMKLLASEIVASFHELSTPIKKILQAPDTIKLKEEMEDLERGSIFRELKITNFLEGDLFVWYTDAWNDLIDKFIFNMAKSLDEYNPRTLSENPIESRDLLKKLYQQLFPKSVRHDLGEYYTPDWLAEHVLNELNYQGNPDDRMLDPGCGSGTFLIMAINKIREWYDENRDECGFDEGGLVRRILKNVVGFDLNPLAVMAARTNYLISIRDLIGRIDEVEIPIYLCDSILTPSEYGGLDAWLNGERVKTKELKTSVANFKIPLEIAKDRQTIAKYAGLLEFCIENSYSIDEFLERCKNEGFQISAEDFHLNLYKELVKLDKENKNGIWARIIKNAFAPLFCDKFDYIAGNPPWINWESLPSQYRKDTQRIWSYYNLVGQIPIKKRQQSKQSKTDISILMTYVSIDSYLKNGGSLGFVITRSLFQAELGGWHFRRFLLPSKEFISCDSINDLDSLKPFRGQAENITCVMKLLKGKKMEYPCPWIHWEPIKGKKLNEDSSFNDVLSSTIREKWIAFPTDSNQLQSSWIFGEENTINIAQRILAPSDYYQLAREGINTRGANGVFFVDAALIGNSIVITNRPQDGKDDKLSSKNFSIESEHLYPLLKGKDVSRWIASPKQFIVLPHSSKSPSNPIPTTALPKKTQEFLFYFKEKLSSRKKFRNFDPKGKNWQGLYSVLKETFSEFKVVWREMADGTIASVVHESNLPNGQKKVMIPDHKLFIIPAKTREEADFICAFLNNSISSYIIKSYALTTGISTHILNRLPIPTYSKSNAAHKQLSEIAYKCHSFANSGESEKLKHLEEQIDNIVAEIWKITREELTLIKNSFGEIEDGKKRPPPILKSVKTENAKTKKLLQDMVSPSELMHLSHKAKYNDMLNSKQWGALYSIAKLKSRGATLTEKQINYLESIIKEAIDQGIIDAKCNHHKCETCNKIKEIFNK